jgi:rubrerythrin
MCVLQCIYISVYEEEYMKQKGIKKNIIPKLKKFYQKLFNKPFSENEYLDGLDLMKTLKHESSKFNLKFIIYGIDENERYEVLNSVCEKSDDLTTTHYLLLLTGYDENKNKMTHVIYIKDLENFMKLHVCPKCGYIPLTIDHGSYHKERFEDHVKNCNGKIEKNYVWKNSQFHSSHIFSKIIFILFFLHIIVKVNTK